MNAPHEMNGVVNCSKLLVAMYRHVGARDGISVVELAKEVGISEREVRLQITVLRLEGAAICGLPSTGYFIAENAEELDGFCDFLKGRALGSLRIVSAMKRIPMPDLLGQLHLPT